LAAARKDGDHRAGSKAARDYPRKKREKPPGPPKIKEATAAEVKRARVDSRKVAMHCGSR
jgi:hypothetical protein